MPLWLHARVVQFSWTAWMPTPSVQHTPKLWVVARTVHEQTIILIYYKSSLSHNVTMYELFTGVKAQIHNISMAPLSFSPFRPWGYFIHFPAEVIQRGTSHVDPNINCEIHEGLSVPNWYILISAEVLKDVLESNHCVRWDKSHQSLENKDVLNWTAWQKMQPFSATFNPWL